MIEQPPVQLIITHHKLKARYFKDSIHGISLEMVRIPAGQFLMGSPASEKNSYGDERPQRLVTVPSFYMGKYPVTQTQWRAVMGDNPSQFPESSENPVDNVSWHRAKEFCQKLSEITRKPYRLPSEAQWEYACRAGTTTPFHFGETISTDLANYDGDSTYSKGIKGIYRKKTTPVGYFKVANAFGLYDMHGNVWEWCEDDWHDGYEGAPTDGTAWIAENGEKSPKKLLRGGSWSLNPLACRSAYRDWYDPAHDVNYVGFRVSCAVSRTL